MSLERNKNILTIIEILILILLVVVIILIGKNCFTQNVSCQKYSDEDIKFLWEDPNINEGLTAGFILYQSDISGDYSNPDNMFTISDPNDRTYSIGLYPIGTYYFVITAYNKELLESLYSNQVELIVKERPLPQPESPKGFNCLGL